VDVEITVVVPVRNRAETVPHLLQALDAQTLPHDRFEVVVVDDGSRDSTPEVLGTWVAQQPHRRTLVRGTGNGPAYARNLGIQRAQGQWVAFTDSDTTPEPGWLEAALAAVEREGTEAVEGAVEPWPQDAAGGFARRISSDGGGRFMTANMIYSKSLLDRLGGFDERFAQPQPFLEDSDLAFRAIRSGASIPFAPEVRVRHEVTRPGPLEILASTRHVRWIPLFAAKHGDAYWTGLRPVVRPLTSVDIDVLSGLMCLAASTRARGLPRAALVLCGANGVRRGLGDGRLAGAQRHEVPARVGLSLALPVARAFWWIEGCVRFRKVVW
jgi:glycosyltransferase involved in cell wall biosynthesis